MYAIRSYYEFYIKGNNTKSCITPDGMVKMPDSNVLIAEMKKHFKIEHIHYFDQIKKYDNELVSYNFV